MLQHTENIILDPECHALDILNSYAKRVYFQLFHHLVSLFKTTKYEHWRLSEDVVCVSIYHAAGYWATFTLRWRLCAVLAHCSTLVLTIWSAAAFLVASFKTGAPRGDAFCIL